MNMAQLIPTMPCLLLKVKLEIALYIITYLICSPAVPPVVHILPEEVQVRKGVSVQFVCSATGVGADSFVYQWFLNDLPVADQDTSTLIIRAVSENNTGDYQCFVRNQYNGIGQSEVTRLILGKSSCKGFIN